MPQVYDRNGRIVDAEDDDILQDGQRMRFNMQDGMSPLQHAIRDHYADDSLQPAHVVDPEGNDGLALNKPGARYLTAGAKTQDYARIVTANVLRNRARAEMIADMIGADAPGDQIEGAPCTVREGGYRGWVEGSQGHLRMIGGKLTCVPDNQDGVDPRDAAYQAMCDELVNAWRK